MDGMLDRIAAVGVTQQTLLLGSIFVAVVLLVLGTASLAGGRRMLARRVNSQAATQAVSLRYAASTSGLGGFLDPLQKKIAPKDAKDLSAIRRRLAQAGYMNPAAVGLYYVLRLALAVALPVLALLAVPVTVGRLDSVQTMILLTICLALGFYGPTLMLGIKIDRRQEEARNGFPDMLDMLLVCVEAGQSLGAALNRVSHEVGKAHPLLGDQLQLVSLEMQAGVAKENALRNMSDRIGIEEVSSLVTLLVQAEAYGTSIGEALRVHAAEMRRLRMLRAEERANKLPVKIALPLMFCILPALLLAIMTPIIIRIGRVMVPSMGGG